jgi:hypothetical protein
MVIKIDSNEQDKEKLEWGAEFTSVNEHRNESFEVDCEVNSNFSK